MIRHYTVALAAFTFLSTPVWAADIQEPTACSVAGLVHGGGIVDRQNVEWAGASVKDVLKWQSLFGEGAFAYSCNGWGAQVDAAAYGFRTDGQDFSTFSLQQNQGHLGGALFYRDNEIGTVGLSASRVFQSFSYDRPLSSLSDSTAMWRVGSFAEYYFSDALTIGGGADYLDGQLGWFDPIDTEGFEANAFVTYYATDNLGLTLRGDLLRSDYLQPNGDKFADIDGNTISLDAEYLIPETSASIFLGGRYAHREVVMATGSALIVLNDLQGFIGAKFAFGSSPPESLRNRDRNGTFDNTSVFHEKLPTIASAMPYN
jgi:hypothetical protein